MNKNCVTTCVENISIAVVDLSITGISVNLNRFNANMLTGNGNTGKVCDNVFDADVNFRNVDADSGIVNVVFNYDVNLDCSTSGGKLH